MADRAGILDIGRKWKVQPNCLINSIESALSRRHLIKIKHIDVCRAYHSYIAPTHRISCERGRAEEGHTGIRRARLISTCGSVETGSSDTARAIAARVRELLLFRAKRSSPFRQTEDIYYPKVAAQKRLVPHSRVYIRKEKEPTDK